MKDQHAQDGRAVGGTTTQQVAAELRADVDAGQRGSPPDGPAAPPARCQQRACTHFLTWVMNLVASLALERSSFIHVDGRLVAEQQHQDGQADRRPAAATVKGRRTRNTCPACRPGNRAKATKFMLTASSISSIAISRRSGSCGSGRSRPPTARTGSRAQRDSVRGQVMPCWLRALVAGGRGSGSDTTSRRRRHAPDLDRGVDRLLSLRPRSVRRWRRPSRPADHDGGDLDREDVGGVHQIVPSSARCCGRTACIAACATSARPPWRKPTHSTADHWRRSGAEHLPRAEMPPEALRISRR